MDIMYRIDLLALHAAVNSASVELKTIVGWYLVLYTNVPPARRTIKPVTNFWCFASPPQSESTAP